MYSKFDSVKVTNLLNEYKIGTSVSWFEGTVFWQIDIQNKIRGGKIILYSKTGKRSKYINWVHALKIKRKSITTYNLKQCLFGEHLLLKYTKPIAIVESEKTACIMSILFEKYLWLATGSLQGLNSQKIEILKNRKIILYPDLGIESKHGSPFSIWKSKCDHLKLKGYDIEISNLLEEKCTKSERENGFDIADYFLKNQFNKPYTINSKTNETILKMYMKNKKIKTLIEELFAKGLIKVVFSTETLAAGINMPAKTTVINNLSKAMRYVCAREPVGVFKRGSNSFLTW